VERGPYSGRRISSWLATGGNCEGAEQPGREFFALERVRLAVREFGGDGIALLRELRKSDDHELVEIIDQCARHALTRKMTGEKVLAMLLMDLSKKQPKGEGVYETAHLYLLSKILDELT
jgi:hypothetical protein